MKQVLFISYLFPPHGGAGVQRSVKFVKYLPQFGWQPTVLTTNRLWTLNDYSFLNEIPKQISIVRVNGPVLPYRLPWRLRQMIRRWFLVVDHEIGWLPFAYRRGADTIRRKKFKILYSTATPYTCHLVALALKKTFGLPWVTDFRDPWIDNYTARFPTPFHRAICAKLERSVVSAADRVLVVSEPMREQFQRRYDELPSNRFVTLPNGFDPADFEGIKPAPRDKRFTLTYTGSFYGKGRSPLSFLTALSQTLDRDLIKPTDICIRFIGNVGHEAKKLVRQFRLGASIEFTGYLSHLESISHQLSADALLLIIGSANGSESGYTGKIFEYLACGKPVFALIPPGAASTLLTEARVGHIVPSDDIDAIANQFYNLYSKWRAGRLTVSPNSNVISRFDRRIQTGKLAEIFDSLSG